MLWYYCITDIGLGQWAITEENKTSSHFSTKAVTVAYNYSLVLTLFTIRLDGSHGYPESLSIKLQIGTHTHKATSSA